MIPALVVLLAAGQPTLVPTRDVDVAYAIAAAQGPALQERVRWSAAQQAQRIDLPDGTWFLVDFQSHTMRAVSPRLRAVLLLPLGAGGPLPGASPWPGGAPSGGYVQQGTATIAGLGCTAWQAQAPGPSQTLCLTDDGVLLGARIGPRVVEAQSVSFAPIDAGVFAVPDGFRVLTAPSGASGADQGAAGQPLQDP